MPKKLRLELGLLKVGELAEKAGLSPSTIRHYTMLGLLSYADRTAGGYRLYDEKSTLERLTRIREKAQEQTLAELRRRLGQAVEEGSVSQN